VYISLIPIFAGLYCALPSNSFFAPYAHLEYVGQSDAYDAGVLIQGAIRRTMRGRSVTLEDRGKKFDVREDMVSVQQMSAPDSARIAFDLLIGLSDENGLVQVEIPLGMRATSRILFDNKNFRFLEFENRDQRIFDDRPLMLAAVQQLLRPTGVAEILGPSIELSDEQEKRLNMFFYGLAGDPIAVSGAYGRMLYFSSIVITTVGFGDIVPMNWVARTIVWIEAVLGVLVAGLFLNAAAHRAAAKAQQRN
jgi:hypothetical protein